MITLMWNLIFFFLKKQLNLYTKQKETNRCRKQTNGYQRGNTAGRDKSEAWDEHAHTATCMNITNKDLRYSPGKSDQYSVISYMRKES